MARTKKEFSKEAMYKKIMPSMLRNAEDKKDNIFVEAANDDIENLNDASEKETGNCIIQEDNVYKYVNTEIMSKLGNNDILEKTNETNETNETNKNDTKDLNEKITVNLVEKLVNEKLEDVLSRFSCCKCSSCKNDIIVIALNNLPTHYFSGYKNELNQALKDFRLDNNIDVVSEIIKAIISIRKKVHH